MPTSSINIFRLGQWFVQGEELGVQMDQIRSDSDQNRIHIRFNFFEYEYG
jgi:hypothetical protein